MQQLVAGEGLLEALHSGQHGAVAVAALLQLHHPRHRLGLALRHRLLHNLHTTNMIKVFSSNIYILLKGKITTSLWYPISCLRFSSCFLLRVASTSSGLMPT